MSLGLVLLIVLVVVLLGGHTGLQWGNGPSGVLGVILIVVLILVLLGRL